MQDVLSIIRNVGIDSLSPMQEHLLKVSESGVRDIVLLSPTGSGKTLAYLLSSLKSIDSLNNAIQAVVILPSRELAMQSDALLKRMKTGVRSLCLVGGHSTTEEMRRIRDLSPHVVFATPGRLNYYLENKAFDTDGVALFVIDEYDKCLDLGFSDEMKSIRGRLPKQLKIWLISATNNTSEFAQYIDLEQAAFVDYTKTEEDHERITNFVIESPVKDKLETLAKLLTYIKGEPTIVFVSYRESADRICAYLKQMRFFVEKYHGGMEQRDRERSLYRFRSGGCNVLVATDLAARGLDIVEVRCIVHYHLPMDEVAFEHRNGRSTRWENSGEAYAIVGPEEAVPAFLSSSQQLDVDINGLGVSPTAPLWATLYIGRGKKDKLSKGDVVGFFCKKGGLKATDIGTIDVGPHYAYVAVKRNRLKSMLKAIAGEKIKDMKTIIEEMK